MKMAKKTGYYCCSGRKHYQDTSALNKHIITCKRPEVEVVSSKPHWQCSLCFKIYMNKQHKSQAECTGCWKCLKQRFKDQEHSCQTTNILNHPVFKELTIISPQNDYNKNVFGDINSFFFIDIENQKDPENIMSKPGMENELAQCQSKFTGAQRAEDKKQPEHNLTPEQLIVRNKELMVKRRHLNNNRSILILIKCLEEEKFVRRSIGGTKPKLPKVSQINFETLNTTYIKTLGEGSYGKVIKAYSWDLKHFVAIKLFQDEAIFTKELNILGLVSQYNSTDFKVLKEIKENNWYGYMINCGVGTLRDLIQCLQEKQDLKLTDSEKYELFCEAVVSVDYMHSHNIFHRDIKPENMVFFNDPYSNTRRHLKLQCIDFSGSEPKWSRVKNLFGTPGYIPEQLYKLKEFTEKDMQFGDSFALCVSFLQLFDLDFQPEKNVVINENKTIEALKKLILRKDKFQAFFQYIFDVIKGIAPLNTGSFWEKFKDLREEKEGEIVSESDWGDKFKEYIWQREHIPIRIVEHLLQNWKTVDINQYRPLLLKTIKQIKSNDKNDKTKDLLVYYFNFLCSEKAVLWEKWGLPKINYADQRDFFYQLQNSYNYLIAGGSILALYAYFREENKQNKQKKDFIGICSLLEKYSEKETVNESIIELIAICDMVKGDIVSAEQRLNKCIGMTSDIDQKGSYMSIINVGYHENCQFEKALEISKNIWKMYTKRNSMRNFLESILVTGYEERKDKKTNTNQFESSMKKYLVGCIPRIMDDQLCYIYNYWLEFCFWINLCRAQANWFLCKHGTIEIQEFVNQWHEIYTTKKYFKETWLKNRIANFESFKKGLHKFLKICIPKYLKDGNQISDVEFSELQNLLSLDHQSIWPDRMENQPEILSDNNFLLQLYVGLIV